MTEHDRAIRDVRRDIIDEIAGEMRGASAREVIGAIVRRLGRGLPPLVEVGVEAGGESGAERNDAGTDLIHFRNSLFSEQT